MGADRYFKRGQAAVELALVSPVLGILLVGTADFARAFYFNQEVVAAARAGAQYGSQSVATAADTTGVRAAALANGVNVPGSSASSSVCTCESPVPTGDTARRYRILQRRQFFGDVCLGYHDGDLQNLGALSRHPADHGHDRLSHHAGLK